MSQAHQVYVGNLAYSTTSADLEDFFAKYGAIAEVKLIMDRETGNSKGFAFITFDNETSAKNAIEANGTEFQGRNLKVSIARRKETGGGGGGGRGGQRWNNDRSGSGGRW